jgi:hypothetical protein
LKYKTGLFLQPDREQGLQTLSQLRGLSESYKVEKGYQIPMLQL